MTPSADAAAEEEGRLRHPLRRSPRGEAAPPREQKPWAARPRQLAVERAGRLETVPFDRANYETVTEASTRSTDWLAAAAIRAISPSGRSSTRPIRCRASWRASRSRSRPGRGLLHAARPSRGRRARFRRRGRRADPACARRSRPAEADARGRRRSSRSAERQIRHVALARYGIALTRDRRSVLMSYALDAGRAEHGRTSSPSSLSAISLPHREGVAGLGPQRGSPSTRCALDARRRICRRGGRYRPCGCGWCSSRVSRPRP